MSDKYRTKIAGNPTWKMHYSELTIQGRANWQYRGGARSALVPSRIQLHKFWKAYPRLTLPLNPTMYDTWGGTSKIIGARGLWKKLSPVEGFGPPTDFQVSWRIWLGPHLPPILGFVPYVKTILENVLCYFSAQFPNSLYISQWFSPLQCQPTIHPQGQNYPVHSVIGSGKNRWLR